MEERNPSWRKGTGASSGENEATRRPHCCNFFHWLSSARHRHRTAGQVSDQPTNNVSNEVILSEWLVFDGSWSAAFAWWLVVWSFVLGIGRTKFCWKIGNFSTRLNLAWRRLVLQWVLDVESILWKCIYQLNILNCIFTEIGKQIIWNVFKHIFDFLELNTFRITKL